MLQRWLDGPSPHWQQENDLDFLVVCESASVAARLSAPSFLMDRFGDRQLVAAVPDKVVIDCVSFALTTVRRMNTLGHQMAAWAAIP